MIRRAYRWWADVPARSWFAHGLVAMGMMMLGAAAGYPLGLARSAAVIGAVLAMCAYVGKELGDWARYRRAGRSGEIHGGASRRADGWGDLVGPFFVAATAALWYLAG